ncbi:MAG: response regulator [Candidatus Margulisbacteria bacterium]|nr:response regulator [Candidatus Margulisiibacteriota bacterium]
MDRKTILVVDDDILIREMLSITFENEIIFTAKNGNEALKIIRNNSTIDCILTDYQMPEMDGLALLKNCKEQYPHIPVIMISGKQDIKSTALNLGAQAFISKPFLPEIVINEVKNITTAAFVR